MRYYRLTEEDKVVNECEVLNIFLDSVDNEQKEQGTTLNSWLYEMDRMGLIYEIN